MTKRVLIIDDSDFMRSIIRDTLSDAGYSIAGEANSAIKGIELYKELMPNLVTMDIIILGENGIETTKKIIAFDRDANILIVSSADQRELLLEAIRSGAKGFVTKPFKPEELLCAVKKFFSANDDAR